VSGAARNGSDVRRCGLVGAGTVGAGIARVLADLGATVVVVAPRRGGLQRAAGMLERAYESDVRRGRITALEARDRLSRMHLTASYADLAGVECVIESVVENLQTKHAVLAAVEAGVSPACIIASNTSAIPISRIAAAAAWPDRVIGAHYFWPAYRYRLVEIIPGEATSTLTLHRTQAMVDWQGKVPLIVGDCPGFFTTRILLVYLNEAIALVTEGAAIDAVDDAMEAFGWAMGPFRLMDAVGIEIFRGVYDAVSPHLGERVAYLRRLWPVLDAGHHGSRRDGAKGFYRDRDGGAVDPRIYSLIGRNGAHSPSPAELSTRPIWQMINEIGHCLAEEVVASADDADRGAALGLGWPQQGGPLAYAQQAGLDAIVETLQTWALRHGPRFLPSPPLLRAASAGTWRRPVPVA